MYYFIFKLKNERIRLGEGLGEGLGEEFSYFFIIFVI
jgi:hypothetical protein